jgi:hypothetical protein
MTWFTIEISYQYLREHNPDMFPMTSHLGIPISPSIICNLCNIHVAEIFQEGGDYCLYCWQERTYPNL